MGKETDERIRPTLQPLCRICCDTAGIKKDTGELHPRRTEWPDQVRTFLLRRFSTLATLLESRPEWPFR